MADSCGLVGQVFAFEPNPIVRPALHENLQMNGFTAVVVRNDAVGESGGKAGLRVPAEDDPTYSNQGLASLAALDTPHRVVEVDVLTLDDFVVERGLQRLDLVKIDTQGYDAKVIRGMGWCLERLSPVIVFEYEAWAWKEVGDSLVDLQGWLTCKGSDVKVRRFFVR